MSKKHLAGLSFSDDAVQLAVIEQSDDGIELQYLEESGRGGTDELWFLEPLRGLRDKKVAKISRLSVALDNAGAFLHTFPLDTSLGQPEQNEQVNWELAALVPGYQPKEYVNDLHVLKARAADQVSDVMAVTVKRTVLYEVEQMLSKEKLEFHIADTNHFCSERALFMTHPEMNVRTVALAGITKDRVDVGLYANGQLAGYRYAPASGTQDVASFIKMCFDLWGSPEVYLHGTGISFEVTKACRTALGGRLATLNPFRRMRIAPAFRGFSKYLGQEHRFAACIGSAVRKQ